MGNLTLLPQAAVIWGEGALAATLPRLGDWGIERPMLFTTRALAEPGPHSLSPHAPGFLGTISDLPAHVPEHAVRQALDASVAHGARAIVAHGGGSVLDAAKAVSHLHQERTGRYIPIAAFPTTLSGSEFSHYFGITETRGEQSFKRSHAVMGTVPTLVVLDPTLLLDTPRWLLLSSAIKGIDHAVEGMRQVEIDHPHAIMAADGVARFFSTLAKWPDGLETRAAVAGGAVAREDLLQLQLAAWHCYFAPASVRYGLSHRIGHILGGSFGVPHSLTSCITLPPVLRACAAHYGERLEKFVAGAPPCEASMALADRIATLVASLGLPTRLRDFDLSHGILAETAQLLKTHYPEELADLGAETDSDERQCLDTLLESLW